MGTLTENWLAGFRVVDDGRTSVATYYWDSGSLSWVAGVQPGAGGGGLTNSVAVTGPLTDAQLRAAVVPVSLASTTVTGSVAVTGPLTDTQLRATPVPTLASKPSVVTRTSVAGAIVDTLILVANANRYGATVYNDSSAVLYLALGTTAASATDYTVQMVANAYYEVPFSYTGQIRGIWSAATGTARVGEVT
jgi:hypothetical protein